VGAENWIWDEAKKMWQCGGDQHFHAQRLRQQQTWTDVNVSDANA